MCSNTALRRWWVDSARYGGPQSGMATLELISHPLCPYVHRAAAFLTDRAIPYTPKYIDLQAKPGWFLEISPRGKVPVLVTDGTPIFESLVILEYLAEVYAPEIVPGDALARARQRMWTEITNDLLAAQYKVAVATTPADRDAAIAAARDTLGRFEQVLPSAAQFFGGDAPNLVDFAAGPALVRFVLLSKLLEIDFYAGLPKVTAWSRTLAARASFATTIPADFDERFTALVRRHDVTAA